MKSTAISTLWVGLLVASIIVGCCSGIGVVKHGPAAGPEDGISALASVLNPGAPPEVSHGVSDANNYVCGGLCWVCDDTAQVDGSAITVGNGGSTGWAVYSWAGLADGNLPAGLTFEMSGVDTVFWVGISNYAEENWEFQGPLTADSTDVVFSASEDYLSPEGYTCIAVVAPGGNTVSIEWVNLVTTNGADRINVDAGHTGTEDGSPENPYNTIQEAVDVAVTGDVIVLAPGLYEITENITLPHAVTVEGAGACRTAVTGGFWIDAPVEEALPVVFNGIECGFVDFLRLGDDKVPIRVQHCAVRLVQVGYPALHDYRIENSAITGGPDGDGNIIINGEWWDCSDNVIVKFNHGEAAAYNEVKNCRINGDLQLAMGPGATNLITGNKVLGNIRDNSGTCTTTISHNFVDHGSIWDSSGGSYEFEDEFIEYNTVVEGVICSRGASATVRCNAVSWTTIPVFDEEEQAYGIIGLSGYPSNIIDNVITIPYFEAADVEIWEITDPIGLRHNAAPGVVTGNLITGGAYGIVDSSGAFEFSDNIVTGAHHGIVTQGGGDYHRNLVYGCTGDGLITDQMDSIFDGNIIRDNGGDGVRILQPSYEDITPDFGGGIQGSAGGNVITGNAGYGLRIEFEASSVATVFAENNYWGVTDETGIAACIYDGDDEAGLALVDFVPFLTTVP